MARFRCNRPTCGVMPQGFVFESDVPRCPRCGALGAPAVHELCDVHFLVMGHGPLMGHHGAHHVACEPERPYLAQHLVHYAASDDPHAVTCPRCRGMAVFQEFVKGLFPHLWVQMQMEKEGKQVMVDLGAKPADCGCGN